MVIINVSDKRNRILLLAIDADLFTLILSIAMTHTQLRVEA